MLLFRATVFLVCAGALLAQTDAQQPDSAAPAAGDEYSGPAILSRGESPVSQTIAPIAFRPYIGVAGVYDSGLVPVSANPNGAGDLYGVELNMGAYTYHVWQHTTLGLDYRGDLRHYSNTYWDGADQFLSLILTHRPTKRVTFTLRTQGGLYSNNYFLSSAVPTADPNYLQLPQNDIYDNRVIFLGAGADMTYKLSARLSFDVGGDGSLVRRQSSALYGMTGGGAHGDLEYRVSRHSTIGADFRYTYFQYTKAYGNSTIESVGVNYSTAFSPHLQLSARLGGARVTSQSLTVVALDPAIAALLGETVAIQAAYAQSYVPDMQVRLSDTHRRTNVTVAYTNQVIPGNGIYLTSRNNAGSGSFSYTGVRHWNFGFNGTYGRMTTLEQTIGAYTAYGGGVGITRDLGKGLYAVLRLDTRHYDISSGALFANTERRASFGLNFSPGDLPLSLW